ncbi:MAG: HAD-IB family phosphatase [Candidatus Hodarchaeota archaeon]
MVKLIIFDVDGVLLEVRSFWTYLHEKLETFDETEYSRNMQMFFQGELSYQEWADLEASAWKDISYEKVKELLLDIPLTKGAEEALNKLNEMEYVAAAVSSGGLLSVLKERFDNLSFKYIYANDLEQKDGVLTGKTVINVPFDKKRQVVEENVLSTEGLEWEECAVIGDSVNDLEIFRVAKLKIAFCPSDAMLVQIADHVIRERDLTQIIPYFEVKQSP